VRARALCADDARCPLLQSVRLVFSGESSVTQGFVDVVGYEIRIGLQDRVARLAGSHQPKQARDREPKPADAGLSGADRGIDSDAGKNHDGRIACCDSSC
jgi:hypothetical protein